MPLSKRDRSAPPGIAFCESVSRAAPGNQAWLYSLLKNSIEEGFATSEESFVTGARLPPGRNYHKIRVGFSICLGTRSTRQLAGLPRREATPTRRSCPQNAFLGVKNSRRQPDQPAAGSAASIHLPPGGRYTATGGGAGVSPWRSIISIIFARSGGAPAAAFTNSAASRKYSGPIAAGVTMHSTFASWAVLLSKR